MTAASNSISWAAYRIAAGALVFSFVAMLTLGTAHAGCKRHIHNSTNWTWTAICRGCKTPWRKIIPPRKSVTIEYTDGWHLARLSLRTRGESHLVRGPLSYWPTWKAPNGVHKPFTLGRIGMGEGGLSLKIASGYWKQGGHTCRDFIFTKDGPIKPIAGRVEGSNREAVAILHKPAHMDVDLIPGQGRKQEWCVYMAMSQFLDHSTYKCVCTPASYAGKISPPQSTGPCNQPGRITHSKKYQAGIALLRTRRHPTQLLCNRLFSRTIRSQNGGAKVRVTFVNRTAERRYVYWIDYSGKPKLMGTLFPGRRGTFNTSSLHPWMIRGPRGCRLVLRARQGRPRVTYHIAPYW